MNTLLLRRQEMRVEIPTGHDTLIRTHRPLAEVYRLDRYYPGQRTFIPRTIPTPGTGVLDSLDVLADFLAAAERNPTWIPMVVGHSDASGSGPNNESITQARAQSMRAFLIDDRQTWLAGTAQDDGEVAGRILFRWVADRYGWDVDTGTDPGWSSRCVDALGAYRQGVRQVFAREVGDGDAMTALDWDAAFELMQDAWVASLRGDPDALPRLRDRLTIDESRALGCADRFVAEASDPSDAEAVRRVEVVLVQDERSLSDDPNRAHGLYDTTWVRRRVVEHPPRVALRLRAATSDGVPLRGLPYTLATDGLQTKGHATAEGKLLSARVPIGPYAVDTNGPEALLAHDLAHRIRLMLERGSPEFVGAVLPDAAGIAAQVEAVYARVFGNSLADDVLQAVVGTPFERIITALLARCGLLPDDEFVFHRINIPRDATECHATARRPKAGTSWWSRPTHRS